MHPPIGVNPTIHSIYMGLMHLCQGGDIEVASDSDSEEETINYLHVESDSSDSDTEDNLMVSQELRPGFCSPVPGSIHGDCADTLEDTLDGLQQSCIYNTVTFGSDTTGYDLSYPLV